MREILFRGKRDKRFGAELWVYGVPFIDTNGDCIMKNSVSERVVVPETVGQFTGLTDKNDNKIFEGDIVRHTQKYELSGEVESTAVIIWNESYSCWSVKYLNGRVMAFLGCEHSKIEIISNIHNNPEMLEEEK